jgi:hypothetical protein
MKIAGEYFLSFIQIIDVFVEFARNAGGSPICPHTHDGS